MLQPASFLIVVVFGLWTSAAAAELQGWRTPDGKLYFGAEPPPGSTRFEAPTPTPRMGPQPSPQPSPTPPPPQASPSPIPTPASTSTPQPTEVPEPVAPPEPTAVPPPTAVPTTAPQPRATPVARGGPPAAVGPAEERSAAPAARADLADCRDFVEIRDTHPTIDFYSGFVRVSGKIVVKGGPVRDVAICIGGNCKPLAGGRALRIGETVPFSVQASRHRPSGLTVRCAASPVR